jgi:hypothetical protein
MMKPGVRAWKGCGLSDIAHFPRAR